MIRKKKYDLSDKLIIDITGPLGNAFYLLGIARELCETELMTEEETNKFIEELKSADYEHLIKTLDKKFGHILILETD